MAGRTHAVRPGAQRAGPAADRGAGALREPPQLPRAFRGTSELAAERKDVCVGAPGSAKNVETVYSSICPPHPPSSCAPYLFIDPREPGPAAGSLAFQSCM